MPTALLGHLYFLCRWTPVCASVSTNARESLAGGPPVRWFVIIVFCSFCFVGFVFVLFCVFVLFLPEVREFI